MDYGYFGINVGALDNGDAIGKAAIAAEQHAKEAKGGDLGHKTRGTLFYMRPKKVTRRNAQDP